MIDLISLIPMLATGMEILTGVSIGLALLGLGAGIYMILTTPTGLKGKEQTFGDFSITGNLEGVPVPMVFGKVRLPGNVIYYGNLQTYRIMEDTGGLFSKRVQVGWKYSVDMWQAICEGPGITLHGIYENDKYGDPDTVFGADWVWTFNDGSSASYPTPSDAPYTTAINPIAHIWIAPWHLEVNTPTAPNLEFLVSRASDTGLTDENLSNGENPAAVIYECFEKAGATPASQFVLSSFEDAASEWSDRGYGLNFKIQQFMDLRDIVLKLRDFVDFSLYQNKDNQWVLTAWKDGEASVADLDEDDYLSFKFKRTTHHKCYSKFTAKMTDEDQDFTERVIGIHASHLPELLTYDKPMDVDLSAFRTIESASRRLMEIVRQHSFPYAEIEITTNLSYMDTIYPGNIITITNADYGYSQTSFRVLDKDICEVDKNELGFTLRQVITDVYSQEGYPAGGSSWAGPDITPYEATEQDIFEAPYNADGSQAPYYVVLAHPTTLAHLGYDVYVSPDDVTYEFAMTEYAWSCHANLDAQYSSSTGYIDNDVGITITPTTPVISDLLESVSRTELFEPKHLCLIDSELMAYETVTDLGGGQYRLTGVIRGLHNTTIATHSIDSDVWLFDNNPALIAGVDYDDFYVKILPFVSPGSRLLTVDDVTAISVSASYKMQTPWPVSRIQVVKSGDQNVTSVWPTTQMHPGAGTYSADAQTDAWPPSFSGEIMWSKGSGYTAETSIPFTITQAGGFTLSIYHRRNGRSSSVKTLIVGAGDGTYTGPDV